MKYIFSPMFTINPPTGPLLSRSKEELNPLYSESAWSNMKLLTQPNRWSCLPTALAMVLDLPVEEIIDTIGHDGSEIIWPENPEPTNRRGFHAPDLVEACLSLGYAAIPIDFNYEILGHARKGKPWVPYNDSEVDARVDKFLKGHVGIIEGAHSADKYHAVAWDGEQVFDPAGRIYRFGDTNTSTIAIERFYIIRKLVQYVG